jgi:hypothetical protein
VILESDAIRHLPRRKDDFDDQTRIVIGKSDTCSMQICDGRHKTKAADDDGNIFVHTSDRLPGVPAHKFKAGFDYGLTQNGGSART